MGSDGRFTVLLLGSDYREGIVGERTDAIIVATLDPASGKVAMVSLPRDTINIPTAPGEAYAERINTLYFDLQQSTASARPRSRSFATRSPTRSTRRSTTSPWWTSTAS